MDYNNNRLDLVPTPEVTMSGKGTNKNNQKITTSDRLEMYKHHPGKTNRVNQNTQKQKETREQMYINNRNISYSSNASENQENSGIGLNRGLTAVKNIVSGFFGKNQNTRYLAPTNYANQQFNPENMTNEQFVLVQQYMQDMKTRQEKWKMIQLNMQNKNSDENAHAQSLEDEEDVIENSESDEDTKPEENESSEDERGFTLVRSRKSKKTKQSSTPQTIKYTIRNEKPNRVEKQKNQETRANNPETQHNTDNQVKTTRESYKIKLVGENIKKFNKSNGLIREIRRCKPDAYIKQAYLNDSDQLIIVTTKKESADQLQVNWPDDAFETGVNQATESENKRFHVIIRGVRKSTKLDDQEFLNEMNEEYGIKSMERITNKHKEQTTLVKAIVANEEDYKRALREGIYINNFYHHTEIYRFRIIRCFKCNEFGHKSINCKSAVDVCLVCKGNHKNGDCLKNTEEPPVIQCSNCNSHDHMANSKECPKFVRQVNNHINFQKRYADVVKTQYESAGKIEVYNKKLNPYTMKQPYIQKKQEKGQNENESPMIKNIVDCFYDLFMNIDKIKEKITREKILIHYVK